MATRIALLGTFAVFILTLAVLGAVLFVRTDSHSVITPHASNVIVVNIVGSSMEPVFSSADEVSIDMSAYERAYPIRGDIARIARPGNRNDVIKFIHAIPSDIFSLKPHEGGSHVIINGEVLTNYGGEPYLFAPARSKMLELYVRDYKGVIPEGAYLVLGNLAQGTEDSTQFGLIAGENIVGKVIEK